MNTIIQQARWLRFILSRGIPDRPKLTIAPAVPEARAAMPQLIREVERAHQGIPRFFGERPMT